jgi:hypothetical protein
VDLKNEGLYSRIQMNDCDITRVCTPLLEKFDSKIRIWMNDYDRTRGCSPLLETIAENSLALLIK